jgi:hypothetical protein
MLKVKISTPDKHKNYDISQYVGNDKSIIDGCQFFINNPTITQADYWFCSEDLLEANEQCEINPKNIYFVTAEAAWPKLHYQSSKKMEFLKQFSKIFTCHPIYLPNVIYDLPFLPWMINANHGPSLFQASERDINFFKNSKKIEKKKIISVFCSNQNMTEDHKLRLNFVKALKKHFGEKLDWYGNGVNSLPAKWEGIAPYKYHIVIENQSKNNVITEKLYDAFLGLSYPIYYGAPNVCDYFDPESIELIDINDLNGSILKIEKLLEYDPYECKLTKIIQAKDKVLSEHNVFRRFARICNASEALRQNLNNSIQEKVLILRSDQFKTRTDLSRTLASRGPIATAQKIFVYYFARLLKMYSDKLLAKYKD